MLLQQIVGFETPGRYFKAENQAELIDALNLLLVNTGLRNHPLYIPPLRE